MQELNVGNFKKTFRKHGLVLLDFYANWCAPCKMMHPVLQKIEKDFPDMRVVKVNVEREKEFTKSFQVTSMPTLVLLHIRKGGVEYLDRFIGYQTRENLKELIKKSIAEN